MSISLSLAGIRSSARNLFFRALRHIASIEDTRALLSLMLERQNARYSSREPQCDLIEERPYPELGRRLAVPAPRESPIFITARFRSGSTLLWHIFRRTSGITAYYEPFNERRWFDIRARGTRVDSTHVGVGDYWAEYDHLGCLANHYREEWIRTQLFMPVTAWNPDMRRYIELMVAHARGRAVLQFNRVDFRLPWLRAQFPNATILHIYRNPRDQWCSTLPRLTKDMRLLTVGEFEPYDGFYLLAWARDLSHCFPFLAPTAHAHPYELFYAIWKLSYSFGRTYAHYSISFEELVENPERMIRMMMTRLQIPADSSTLAELVGKPEVGKWRKHADHDWYADIEARVDDELRRFFRRNDLALSVNRRLSSSQAALPAAVAPTDVA